MRSHWSYYLKWMKMKKIAEVTPKVAKPLAFNDKQLDQKLQENVRQKQIDSKIEESRMYIERAEPRNQLWERKSAEFNLARH